MDELAWSDVADTGLLTLFCRALESRSAQPILRDPAAEELADHFAPELARSPRALHRRIARGRIEAAMVVHIALRARKFDDLARAFVDRHPPGCVVNLGCGMDTRFRRIDDGRLRFYDLDLPEVIAAKRRFVEETARYHLLASSVLDHAWIDGIAQTEGAPLMFLAEGLFMYLPAEGVIDLVRALRRRFPGSELVFEAFNSRWLTPFFRRLVNFKLRRQLGLGRGAEFRSGIRDGHEPEGWSDGIRLLAEWSYLDEDEPKIGMLRAFRRWQLFRRTQWTVHYRLGPP